MSSESVDGVDAPQPADTQQPSSQPSDARPSEARPAGMLPIQVNGQYVKDLSFENPRAPSSLQQQSGPPQIEVNVDVRASRLTDGVFETVLSVTADAKVNDEQLFMVELSYAGVFTLENMPEQQLQSVLLIECPRLLFPFARAIVADVTRDGGFPPLLIQPVDFADLFRRSQLARAAEAAKETASPGADTPADTPADT